MAGTNTECISMRSKYQAELFLENSELLKSLTSLKKSLCLLIGILATFRLPRQINYILGGIMIGLEWAREFLIFTF